MKYFLLCLISLFLLGGCGKENSGLVKMQDIKSYLLVDVQKNSVEFETYNKGITFWSGKLKEHPGDSFFKQMLSAGFESRFRLIGSIDDLLASDSLLQLADKEFKGKDVSVLLALAQNSISRHRFKQAVEYSRRAYLIPESRVNSAMVLADALIETGEYHEATGLIERYKDDNSIPYLVRKSKLMEHNGNLDSAILTMRTVYQLAKKDNNITMICYSDNLIGIYCIESGKMKEAYDAYLGALGFNPHYAAAIEGIATIAMLNDNNAEIAKDIYESLSRRLVSPDPYLNLYKIAKYNNDNVKKQEYLDTFYQMTLDPKYGRMYNKYLVNIEAEEFKDFDKAKTIAESEIQERPTPNSYFLLAWTYFQKGDSDKAIEIIKDKVEGKTFDPEILAKIDRIYLEQTKKL